MTNENKSCLASAIIIILTIIICVILIPKAVAKIELNECKQWQEDSKTMPNWYATDWQKEQCDHYSIQIIQNDKTPHPAITVTLASWYDYDLNTADQKCTNDQCWSKHHNTCATRKFKRGTTLVITNLENEKQVECFVNDYGPSAEIYPDREVDLSSHAFSQIADLSQGVVAVQVWIK